MRGLASFDRFTSPSIPRRTGRTAVPGALVAAAVLLMLVGGAGAQVPRPTTAQVLAINPTSYITEHGTFTVSLEVADAAGIQFVYFTFCQLSSPVCYSPVAMVLQGTNWFVGTTKPMTSYPGMTEGVRAGYNITLQFADNTNQTEPSVPNPFGNLTLAQSVTGEYMFQMTVSPQQYALTGEVTDSSTGAPISGASVDLNLGNQTTTSATGSYSFAGLVNGSYALSVSAAGYPKSDATVMIAGENSTHNFAISNASSHAESGGAKTWYSTPIFGVSPLVILPALVVLVVVALLGVFLWKRRGRSPPIGAGRLENPESPPRNPGRE